MGRDLLEEGELKRLREGAAALQDVQTAGAPSLSPCLFPFNNWLFLYPN